MKKRKLEHRVFSVDDKQKIAAEFEKLLPGLKLSQLPDGGGLKVDAAIPSSGLVTTNAIRKLMQAVGVYLHSCDLDLSALTIQVQFGTAPLLLVAEQQPDLIVPQQLPSGMSEDQMRIDQLKKYATNYLGPLTPSDVTLEVCDTKMKPVGEDAKQQQDAYKLRVKGWREATLEQLEAFKAMFPYHVTDVQVSGQQYEIILSMQGSLAPARPLWQRLFRS
jgi:hypothetical protein